MKASSVIAFILILLHGAATIAGRKFVLRPPDTDANDKTILSKPEDEVNAITFQLMDNEIPGPCFFIDDLCDDAAEGLALRDLGLLKNKNHNNCSVSQSLQNIGRMGANKDSEGITRNKLGLGKIGRSNCA